MLLSSSDKLSQKQQAAAIQREAGKAIRADRRDNRYAVPQATFDLWGDRGEVKDYINLHNVNPFNFADIKFCTF